MLLSAPTHSEPIPAHFENRGDDSKAIQALLDGYNQSRLREGSDCIRSAFAKQTIPFSGEGAVLRAHTLKIANPCIDRIAARKGTGP